MKRTTMGGLLAAAMFILSTGAHAQLFRTYLSINGNDANPCNLVAPCRLLPAALNAVADGGEIWMLDSANFNTSQVNVTKSVTILAVPGVVGSVVIAASDTAAINIATAGVKVGLRNLVVVPLPGVVGNAAGVRMTAGAHLSVEGSVFVKAGYGIDVRAVAKVVVVDSSFRGGDFGILLDDGASGTIARSVFMDQLGSGVTLGAGDAGETTRADIGSSTFQGGQYAIYVTAGANGGGTALATVSGNLISRSNVGLAAVTGAGGTSKVTAFGNTISQNSSGIIASGAGAKVVASGNLLNLNFAGFSISSGTIESAGNNTLRDNTTDVSGGTLTPMAMQ